MPANKVGYTAHCHKHWEQVPTLSAQGIEIGFKIGLCIILVNETNACNWISFLASLECVECTLFRNTCMEGTTLVSVVT